MSVARVTTVIPTFNEGDRLGAFLEDWAADACAHAAPIVTAVIVDDGSNPQDEARQRAAVNAATARLQAAGAPHRMVYLRAERNQGKGASIRWGWSQAADAASTWWSFIDADGAVPASEFWRVASMLARHAGGHRVRFTRAHGGPIREPIVLSSRCRAARLRRVSSPCSIWASTTRSAA